MRTSVQHGSREPDRMILEPVSKYLIGDLHGYLDLRQLDGRVLPPGSDCGGGHGHGCDQSQSQNKYDNLSHIFLTFVVGSTTQMDGALI